MKAIAIVSGGLDSITLAYFLKSKGYDLTLLSFDYDQRHRKELDFAFLSSQNLECRHTVISLSSLGKLLTGSALTDNKIEVPEGHYEAESMKATVVPNRNAIMLSIAYGIAVAEQAEIVATGVHAGDHFIYPDCREMFIVSFDSMQKLAVEGYGHPDLRLYAPFVRIGKHDIVTIGAKLSVPFEETWSCYKGQDLHCGKCGTCVERIEAFELAGVEDPTEYALHNS